MAGDQKLRVGIIGCGVIAPTHIESYQRLEGVEVAWACDTQLDRAAYLAERYGIARRTASLDEVLADDSVDLVSICTPHADHADHVEAALAAGKHVLCEKALAASTEQLDRMLAAHAAADGLRFGGVFQHRFDGVVGALRQVVASGDLGTTLIASARLRCFRSPDYYSDDWHGTWAREGGSALINQSIHFLDSIQWIMGGVGSVMAHYDNRSHAGQTETEDVLTASLRYADGALGTFEVTTASNLNWQNQYTLHGTHGAIEVFNGKPTHVQFADDTTTQRVSKLFESAGDPERAEGGKEYYGSGHTAQVADFVAAVRHGREPFVTGRMAAHTNRVVLAAYESHRTGKRIDVSESLVSSA